MLDFLVCTCLLATQGGAAQAPNSQAFRGRPDHRLFDGGADHGLPRIGERVAQGSFGFGEGRLGICLKHLL